MPPLWPSPFTIELLYLLSLSPTTHRILPQVQLEKPPGVPPRGRGRAQQQQQVPVPVLLYLLREHVQVEPALEGLARGQVSRESGPTTGSITKPSQ